MAVDESELSKEEQKARNDANNANTLRNAADVAVASGNPYAVAIGGAVKAADKVTGGKATEYLGKSMTQANKVNPGGKALQGLSNKLAESGAGDKIGQGARMYNSAKGGTGGGAGAADAASKGADAANKANQVNQVKNANAGGGQGGSLPSSGKEGEIPNKHNEMPQAAAGNTSDSKKKGDSDNTALDRRSKKAAQEDAQPDEAAGKTAMKMGTKFLLLSPFVQLILFALAPFIIIMLFMILAVGMITGMFDDYEDALGVSQTVGEENGNVNFVSNNKEQQAFYDRINDVKLEYQANGKTVDAVKIVAVYHIINTNDTSVHYDDMSKSDIEEIAAAMFSGNSYNEDTFKENLKNDIFKKYFPKSSDSDREKMVKDVFTYVSEYDDLVGRKKSGLCSSSGSCAYDIKGYYISNKGNVTENLQVSDIYVRLMQCGGRYGGTYGQPLAGEELIPFEKYVLGVAYLEVGESFHAEAQKAEMIAARSFALARHADMGGWRTLKQEDGKWILQVAACTADQVYCDPDQGCSGDNGQWSQVHSGLSYANGFSRGPMAEDSPMRTYATETEGEVLVNSQGYIIYTTYINVDQNKWNALAKSGLNYKQILLQYYNQGSKNFGAADIQKASCGGSGGSCSQSSGEYAQWKQYEGEWTDIQMGNSGKNIRQIGCLVTSVSIQIARSGVETNISGTFNPGTFVEFLNSHGGFVSGGNFVWGAATQAAPSFKYQGQIDVSGLSRSEKLNAIKNLVSQSNVYVVAEVKGNTGQHWVAIDNVNGDTINMMDPGSTSTDMWAEYNWANTSTLAYYRVEK